MINGAAASLVFHAALAFLPSPARSADAGTIGRYNAAMTPDEKVQVLMEHPDESPEIVGALPYLIHPPSKLASTERWRDFRDRTLLPLIEARPENPHLPLFLAQAEKVLAWRETIPPERCIWTADA